MATKISRKCRNDFASRSSGSGDSSYYDTKGHGVDAFYEALQDYDFGFYLNDVIDFCGDAGRKVITITDEFGDESGCAVLSWYRLPSGRYEFTGYIT